MSELSKRSANCKVFDNWDGAEKYGEGGIFYSWLNERKQFSEDVECVFIVMPSHFPDDKDKNPVMVSWQVGINHPNGSRWKLTGTYDKPTLSPSLFWIEHWHGFLENGYLRSCD